MNKLKDKFWLWGQSAGCHHELDRYKLPGENLMETKEGCDFLGIEKACRVAMGTAGPFPPFDAEAEKIKNLKEIVWSSIGAGGVKRHNDDNSDLDEVLRMAEIYPNITGSILDDFFSSVEFAQSKPARHSLESVKNMQKRLHDFHKRRLDLWLVWYTYQLGYDIQQYIELFDVITMWTWKGSDLPALRENIGKIIEKTPGKRRLAGCYMWNYGERKPLTIEQMKHQCEIYYDAIKSKELDGIIFCSNCICDIGLEAVEWTKNWIKEVGDEKITGK